MKDFSSIIAKIKEDENLKKQFTDAVKENRIVEFLKSIGVETSKEEIAEFLNAKKKEITDEESLKNASGGGCSSESTPSVVCHAALSTMSAGTVCAFSSILYAADLGTNSQTTCLW